MTWEQAKNLKTEDWTQGAPSIGRVCMIISS